MRIGRIMIDTDEMSVEELTTIINELHNIRHRRERKEQFSRSMTELLTKAANEGFTFYDKDFGQVIEGADLIIFDAEDSEKT